MENLDIQETLAALGLAGTNISDSLKAYCAPPDLGENPPAPLPLTPEPHVETWQGYGREAVKNSVLPVLQKHFAQFSFPISDGISKTDSYRACTLKGQPPSSFPECTEPAFNQPSQLRLEVYEGPAGPVPILSTPDRQDFESLVRMFCMRNEPQEVPPSMGAAMVSGLINWDRIHTYRAAWEKDHPDQDWSDEFPQFIKEKSNFQDRIILLSQGPYSGIPAEKLGLSETEWLKLSYDIRREHECTHHLTKRLFGLMRKHVVDEIIADTMGILAACGSFRKPWLLHFLGLDEAGSFNEGGRLGNYVQDVDNKDVAIIFKLSAHALNNLETYFQQNKVPQQPGDRARLAAGLYQMGLHELAAPDGSNLIRPIA